MTDARHAATPRTRDQFEDRVRLKARVRGSLLEFSQPYLRYKALLAMVHGVRLARLPVWITFSSIISRTRKYTRAAHTRERTSMCVSRVATESGIIVKAKMKSSVERARRAWFAGALLGEEIGKCNIPWRVSSWSFVDPENCNWASQCEKDSRKSYFLNDKRYNSAKSIDTILIFLQQSLV